MNDSEATAADIAAGKIAPGIYEGVPFSDYIAIDAISNTRLGMMERSPAHYHANVELERTKPLALGQLIHAGRLEPLSIAERYAVMPDYHLDPDNVTTNGQRSTMSTTRYVKERAAEFMHANGDREVVSREWYGEMSLIVGSLCRDEAANKIFNCPGPVEVTLVWNDDVTGLLCKARLDKLCVGHFADLKSCAELESFERNIARYGYHRQAAHYRAGYAALTGELIWPWIVAVEKSAPYCVMTAPVDEESLIRGEERRRAAIDRIAECKQSNHWPGPPSPRSWRVPEWELNSGDPLELIMDGEAVTL